MLTATQFDIYTDAAIASRLLDLRDKARRVRLAETRARFEREVRESYIDRREAWGGELDSEVLVSGTRPDLYWPATFAEEREHSLYL